MAFWWIAGRASSQEPGVREEEEEERVEEKERDE